MATEYAAYENFREPGNIQKTIVGPTLVSGDLVVAPTHKVHPVSGTAAITTITVPYPGFQGNVMFLPTGVFTWTTAVNIALAGTAVVGKTLTFTYNPVTAKWYPSYVA